MVTAKLLTAVLAVLCLVQGVTGSARRLRDLPAAVDEPAVVPEPVGTRSNTACALLVLWCLIRA
jgi:hypothetical protein